MLFTDKAPINTETREAISVRDGVIEYLGAEIGMEPEDKVFRVYRSPATIANIHPQLVGLVLTDGHVDTDVPAPESGMGRVADSRMVDIHDEGTATSIAVKNQLDVSEAFRDYIDDGRRELSLAYFGDLVEHHTYDFEQIITAAHHLAAVESGRCGSVCSFLDEAIKSGDTNMQNGNSSRVFLDADGNVSLQRVMEIINELPEAVKYVGIEDLMDVIPQLEEIVKMSKGDDAAEEGSGEDQSEGDYEDEGGEEEEDEPDNGQGFSDSKAFRDAIQAEMAEFSRVTDKARHFVDESYSFAGKTKEQVMRDALATEHDTTFSDEQLPVAFEMLKKTEGYQNFADAGAGSEEADPFAKIKDKEL